MNSTAKLILLLFTSIAIIQSNNIVSAQTAEEINRGIPWFILMIVVVIIVAIVAGLRQRMKK